MDIFVKESTESTKKKESLTRVLTRRRSKNERRKARLDRRKSVNEGLIVNLSIKEERRSGQDRRKLAKQPFEVNEEQNKPRPAEKKPEDKEKKGIVNIIV